MSYLLMRLGGAKIAFRSLVSSLGEESWGQKARNEVTIVLVREFLRFNQEYQKADSWKAPTISAIKSRYI